MKKTSITLTVLIATAAFGLTACSASESTSNVIPDVEVSATASPPATPADTPTAAPDVAPSGDVTSGQTYDLTVPVGKLFAIPVEANGAVVDIQQEGTSISRDVPTSGGTFYGQMPPSGDAILFSAKSVGVTTGSIRILGKDGNPNGTGTRFTITVVK